MGFSTISYCDFYKLKNLYKDIKCIIVCHSTHAPGGFRTHCHLFFYNKFSVPGSFPFCSMSLKDFKFYMDKHSKDEVMRYENI